MEISVVRDYVISILGSLCIILTIALIIALAVISIKLKRLLQSVNKTLKSVEKRLAYVRGLAKGFTESVMFFKKGGD